MFNIRNNSKLSGPYNFPRTKLKNIFCIKCKHQFFLEELVPLQGLVPLLLVCGHTICETCVKLHPNKPCTQCNVISQSQVNKKVVLPLNMYAIGLMVTSYNRPVRTDDTQISFNQSINSKFRQQCIQGLCHECGIQATLKCPQCNALYCFSCYTKIHGRALQSHTKIVLSENNKESYFTVRNVCSETCNNSLGYYCNDCQLAGCSHCILRLHPKHDYISLRQKNEELLPEFSEVSERVSESLLRVHQAEKKLKKIRVFPSELQNSENVEASITQHFAQLHGILQNMEKKFIDKLYEQRTVLGKDLSKIEELLRKQEDQLQSALVMITSILDNLGRVDIREVISNLQELADIPCHLVQDSVPEHENISFNIDKTIIDALENHCTIEIPSISGFSLQRTGLLPDDYEIEPLTRDTSMMGLLPNLSISKTSTSSVSTLPRRKTPNTVLSKGSSEMVRITHIVDPFCFYVQQIYHHSKIAEMTEGLTSLANTTDTTPTDVILNKLYIVQDAKDKMWYRGRVIERVTESNDDRYGIFFVDFGMTDNNVSITRMRNIPPRFSTLPVMAIRCALSDVVPNNGIWCPKAIEAFRKLVAEDAIVSMEVVTICGDVYYVDLCVISSKNSALASVIDSLTYMKYASRLTPNRLMRTNPDSTRKYFREQLDMENYTDVEILFVESVDSIYVQKAQVNRGNIVKMVHEMNEEYEANMASTGFIHVPVKDLPCAALDADGYWQRAIVCDVPNDNVVKVFYVDLGYTLQLQNDSIRTLSYKYMNYRTQAIKVSLKDIKPQPEDNGHWSTETIEHLKHLLMNAEQYKVIAFEKLGDAYRVSMFTNDMINIATLLLEECTIISTKSSDFQDGTINKKNKKRKYKNKRNIITKELGTSNVSSSSTKEMNTSKELEDPFKICVLIHQVESPDHIYVSDSSCQQSNMEMIAAMNNFYSKYRSTKKIKWQKDAICAVYSEKDKSYIRAKILEVKPTDEVLVFLFDVGITETIPLKHVQSLSTQFLHIPAYLFKIKLAGILPCGGTNAWPSFSCGELQEIINENLNSKFYISKLEDDTEAESLSIPVELWVKQTKMDGPLTPTRINISSVNRMLVEKGAALPIQDYAKKRDHILAIELKRLLTKRQQVFSKQEKDIKWLSINESDYCPFVGQNVGSNHSKVLSQQSDISSGSEDYLGDVFPNIQIPPKLSAWVAANPLKENQFIAIPTSLDYDGFLHLHPKQENSKMLRSIESKLEEFYKNTSIEECDMEWAPGDLCVAQYHVNKKWYRAKVLKVQGYNMCEVEFVDYGNIEECEIGTLKKKVILGHIPIQCTKCQIYGLNSGNANKKCTTQELDIIHSLLIEKECEVTVLDKTNTHYVVSITLLPNKLCKRKCDLITFLIDQYEMNIIPHDDSKEFEVVGSSADTADMVIEGTESASTDGTTLEDAVISGHSILCQKQSIDKDADNDSKETIDLTNMSWNKLKDNIVSSTPHVFSEEDLFGNYKVLNIPSGVEFIEVELCCGISPTKFYAQLQENTHSTVLNNYYKDYELLMKELQENARKQPIINSLMINTPCCAKFSDGIWYRCLIVDTEENEDSDNVKIRLLYVDFGNDEYITVNSQEYELYSLKTEWFKLPVMAVKCQLWNIEVAPDADYSTLIEELKVMYNMPVIATIEEFHEEFISVKLYKDLDKKEVMYNSLIEADLFRMK